MKTLHLLRHAKSSWDEPGLEDHDRPLAERGSNDARALADALRTHPISVDLVLCSTARRARQTLDPLRESLGSDVRVRYERGLFHAPGDVCLARLRKLGPGVDHVLLVGHSPGLDELLALLVTEGAPELRAALAHKFPTGTLVSLEMDIPRFGALTPGSARLVAVRRPGRGAVPGTTAVTPPPTASKARPLVLQPDARWGEAGTATLEAVRAHFEANLAGSEDGQAACVHQLRVAMRRARVGLSTFEDILPEAERAKLALDLRWLGRKLGPLREAQVFGTDVVAALRARSPRSPAVRALEAAVAAETHVRMHEARAALRGPRGRATRRRFVGLAVVDRGHADRSARGRAAKRLDKRLRRALERRSAIAGDDADALHELRKTLKKLRYTAELLGSLFDSDATRGYVAKLSRLQDVIGAMQDELVARRLVRELLERHGGTAHLRRAARLYDAFAEARRREDHGALEQAFAAFEHAEPFWRS